MRYSLEALVWFVFGCVVVGLLAPVPTRFVEVEVPVIQYLPTPVTQYPFEPTFSLEAQEALEYLDDCISDTSCQVGDFLVAALADGNFDGDWLAEARPGVELAYEETLSQVCGDSQFSWWVQEELLRGVNRGLYIARCMREWEDWANDYLWDNLPNGQK